MPVIVKVSYFHVDALPVGFVHLILYYYQEKTASLILGKDYRGLCVQVLSHV